MILFFDVETQGLPDFKKRASDPTQPHIVQLAAMLTDGAGKVIESHNVLIKPDGWEIPEDVIKVHGITNEIAAVGLPEALVAGLLMEMIKKSAVIVAHGVTFDKFMSRIAMRRFGLLADEQDEWWKGLNTYCTMHNMTDICKLPGKFGNKFKFPKLQEAYLHAFGKEFIGAHDALADLIACKELYFWLNPQTELPKA